MKLFRKVPKWARPTKADKAILNWFLALKPGDIAYDCDGFKGNQIDENKNVKTFIS